MLGKIYRYSSVITLIFSFLMFFFVSLICFTSCTLSVTSFHTQGSASDVVDEAQTVSPETNATVDIPLTK